MRNFSKLIISILVLSVILVAIFFALRSKEKVDDTPLIQNDTSIYSPQVSPREKTTIEINGAKLEAELAMSAEEQGLGLSGRDALKENEGMLFVFERPDSYKFWMKDMKFSIDMIWINEDKKITYIKKDARPESFPEGFGPETSDTKYVLEVSSGFSERNNIKVGDSVLFAL